MILITGGTGLIGRHIIKALMEQGVSMRCLLTENKQKDLPWDKWDEFAPEIITGTLLDEEAVFEAVSGAHTIIHLESAMWWGRSREMERIEVVGTRNLITVARSARIGRIITISQLGASTASAFPLLSIKGQVEDLIRNSGIAYTIIRSGLIFGEEDAFVNHICMLLSVNPLFFLMPGRGEVILHPIYIDDLILALTKSLNLIDTVDKTIEIGGPEYITFDDMLRTIMRIIGAPRIVFGIPPYLMRWIIAAYRFIMPRTLMTSQWLDILASSRTTRIGNTFNIFGFHPRRFEDTLVTYLPNQHYFLRALRYVMRRRPRGF